METFIAKYAAAFIIIAGVLRGFGELFKFVADRTKTNRDDKIYQKWIRPGILLMGKGMVFLGMGNAKDNKHEKVRT